MAKGRRKARGFRMDVNSDCSSSDEDESVETCSVHSGYSQSKNAGESQQDSDSSDSDDALGEKLAQTLDRAEFSKSGHQRSVHLQELCETFQSNYIPQHIEKQQVTLSNIVNKGLNGGSDEQMWAAHLAPNLVLQYGGTTKGINAYHESKELLTTLMHDSNNSSKSRVKAIKALGLATHIIAHDDHAKLNIMHHLHKRFGQSFLKGNGKPRDVESQESSVHQAALTAWALILTSLSPHAALNEINNNISNIRGLLEASEIRMRAAAGEVLATLFEIAREHDEDFTLSDTDALCEKLRFLATGSQKYIKKRDRHVQKSTFRDVEKSIKIGMGPDMKIQFGEETLHICTWEDKLVYDSLRSILGSGTNRHLRKNPVIRDLFDLGTPLEEEQQQQTRAVSKFDKKMGNIASDRYRTKWLSKARDKRMDVM